MMVDIIQNRSTWWFADLVFELSDLLIWMTQSKIQSCSRNSCEKNCYLFYSHHIICRVGGYFSQRWSFYLYINEYCRVIDFSWWWSWCWKKYSIITGNALQIGLESACRDSAVSFSHETEFLMLKIFISLSILCTYYYNSYWAKKIISYLAD